MRSRVHIVNVPSAVTVEELRAVCRRLGLKGDVHLARDAVSSRFAGEAYLACDDRDGALAAASALEGRVVGGVPLHCEVVDTEELFDRDGLFGDGEAPMGRQDGTVGRGARDEQE